MQGEILGLNPDHPLNRDRLFWWLPLPGRFGGPVSWDLVGGLPMRYAGYGNLADTGFAWTPQSSPGGYGSTYFAQNSGGAFNYLQSPSVNPSPQYITVGAWANTNDTGLNTNQTIFTKPVNGSPGGQPGAWTNPYLSFLLRFSSDTQCETAISLNGSYTNYVQPANTLSRDRWYRFVMTYDGAALNLYQNGALFHSGGVAGGAISWADMPYQIGMGNGTSLEQWVGWINDCTFSGRAWSAQEVALDYELSQQGYPGVLLRQRPRAYSLPPSVVSVYPEYLKMSVRPIVQTRIIPQKRPVLLPNMAAGSLPLPSPPRVKIARQVYPHKRAPLLIPGETAIETVPLPMSQRRTQQPQRSYPVRRTVLLPGSPSPAVVLTRAARQVRIAGQPLRRQSVVLAGVVNNVAVPIVIRGRPQLQRCYVHVRRAVFVPGSPQPPVVLRTPPRSIRSTALLSRCRSLVVPGPLQAVPILLRGRPQVVRCVYALRRPASAALFQQTTVQQTILVKSIRTVR